MVELQGPKDGVAIFETVGGLGGVAAGEMEVDVVDTHLCFLVGEGIVEESVLERVTMKLAFAGEWISQARFTKGEIF